LVLVKTPEGSSLAETDRALRFAEEQLKAMPSVESFFSNLGHANPLIYYNLIPHDDAPNYGELFVKLRDYTARTMSRRLDELRKRVENYPNARIEVKEFDSGPLISAPISIRVIGPSCKRCMTWPPKWNMRSPKFRARRTS